MPELSITSKEIESVSKILKVLSNSVSLKILEMLGEKELKFRDILEDLNVSESTAYRHLAVLRDKHILTASRYEGGEVFYSVKDLRILELFNMLKEPRCQN